MSSRLRAATVALLAILVLAAGVVPACGADMCCSNDAAAVLHRAMPCCDEPTMAASDVVQLLPPAPAVPQAALPVAVIESPADRTLPGFSTAHVFSTPAHHQPPPLFLLNEQFLI